MDARRRAFFFGGVAAGILAGVILVRRRGISVGKMADVAAPAIAIGYVIGRLGCLLNGCCYGKVAVDLPWALACVHGRGSQASYADLRDNLLHHNLLHPSSLGRQKAVRGRDHGHTWGSTQSPDSSLSSEDGSSRLLCSVHGYPGGMYRPCDPGIRHGLREEEVCE